MPKPKKVKWVKVVKTIFDGVSEVLEQFEDVDFEEVFQNLEGEDNGEGFGKMKEESSISKDEAKEILGVRSSANKNTIDKRYKFLAKMCHPDRFQEKADKDMADKEMKKYNDAYAVLTTKE